MEIIMLKLKPLAFLLSNMDTTYIHYFTIAELAKDFQTVLKYTYFSVESLNRTLTDDEFQTAAANNVVDIAKKTGRLAVLNSFVTCK